LSETEINLLSSNMTHC